jgi:hypothetical protein
MSHFSYLRQFAADECEESDYTVAHAWRQWEYLQYELSRSLHVYSVRRFSYLLSIIDTIKDIGGVRGGAVGWGTALQADSIPDGVSGIF